MHGMYVCMYVFPGMRVLEYGAGGSTLFFGQYAGPRKPYFFLVASTVSEEVAARDAATWHSTEHDAMRSPVQYGHPLLGTQPPGTRSSTMQALRPERGSIFLATFFRRMPTANAEGLDRIGGVASERSRWDVSLDTFKSARDPRRSPSACSEMLKKKGAREEPCLRAATI